MRINKRGKSPKKQSQGSFIDSDFASGFEDSKFDKFKPFIKVLVVILMLAGATWGVSAYFAGTDEKNDTNKTYSSNTTQPEEDLDAKLSQCLSNVTASHPTPEASDGDFWPKLIAGYDAQLGCYDQYPDASGSISRSSTEYARDNALDSSGSYKDTYASSSSNGSPTSSKSSVTGCDYSLNERDFLACSDKYYATHSSPSSTPPSNTGNASTPSYTSPSTSSTPPSSSGGSSSSSSSSAADRAYWQNKCEEQVRQQSGGTSLTASQRAAMVSQCMASRGY